MTNYLNLFLKLFHCFTIKAIYPKVESFESFRSKKMAPLCAEKILK